MGAVNSISQGEDGVAASRRWWESRLTVALALVAAAVPLLYPPIPPLVDLIGHMGRFEIALEGSSSPTLSVFYSYHWIPIGNLGLDILVRLFAPIFGLEVATKWLVVAIPVLTVAGFLWAAREVHGRIPPTAFLAIPFAYGQPFLFGFVNFALSMAIAFLGFALWLRLGRLGRERLRSAVFVPLSFVAYFAHVYGWGVLVILCFSAEVIRQREAGGSWLHAGVRAAFRVVVLGGPFILMILWRSDASARSAWAWFEWTAKLMWATGALRDRWAWLDGLSMAVVIFVLIIAGRRGAVAPLLALPALLLIGVYLLLPETLFGSTYADMRVVPYIFALLLLAVNFRFDRERDASVAATASLIFLLVRIAANTASLAAASDEQGRKIVAIDHVPTGARVATFVQISCEGRWALGRDNHLGSLVIVRRQGFSNDQWLIDRASGLGLNYRQPGPFAVDPSQIVLPNGCSDGAHHTIDEALAGVPRHSFDYVWLLDVDRFDPRLAQGLTRVWSTAGSAIYRIAPQSLADTTAKPRLKTL